MGLDNPLLAAAIDYAALGWQVVPLHELRPDRSCSCGRPGCGNSAGKHPRLNEWQKHATADHARVLAWWQQWPGANVGVKCGSGSGLVAVDVDPPRGEEFLIVISDGDLPETVEMLTGKGRRILYAIPDGLDVEPRTATFKDEDGNESIRLQGGTSGAQFVAPPSLHPSGRRYRWAPGRGPDDRRPAPMPGWVVAEMCRPEKAEEADPPRRVEQDAPWVEFNRRDSWHEWLTDWGYKPAGGRSSVRYYTRPGKAGGVSVSVGHYQSKDGTPALYTFSGNCPHLPGAKCYDLFGAYARIEHGGDFSAAARALLGLGYGKPRVDSLADRVARLEERLAQLERLAGVRNG